MNARALFLLLLLLAGAVAWVVWFDDGNHGRSEGALEPLLARDTDSVTALELEGKNSACRIERTGEGWRLAEPVVAEADPRRVRTLLSTIRNARVVEVVTDTPDPGEPFGLASPEATLRLYFQGGGAPFVLRLGRASPVGSERYASVGDGRILLVSGSLDFALARSPEQFRERRFLPVEAEHVRRIVLESNADPIVLEREGTRWLMLSPVVDKADFGECDRLARALTGLAAERFAEGAELANAVALPRLAVEVSDGEHTRRFEIVGRAGPDEFYAQRVGVQSPVMGVLPARRVSELAFDPDHYRDASLVYLSRGDVLEIRLKHRGSLLIVSRVREGEPWTVRTDGGSAQRADGSKVNELLDHLRWVRARSFESAAAFEEDVPTEIVLEGESGELGRLRIGRALARSEGDEEALVAARSSWRSGFRFAISASLLELLPRVPDDLAPRSTDGTS